MGLDRLVKVEESEDWNRKCEIILTGCISRVICDTRALRCVDEYDNRNGSLRKITNSCTGEDESKVQSRVCVGDDFGNGP